MAKKEKIAIIRPDEFGEVDEALTEALAGLDEANTRVSSLLESERRGEDPPELTGVSGDGAVDASASDSAVETSEPAESNATEATSEVEEEIVEEDEDEEDAFDDDDEEDDEEELDDDAEDDDEED